MTTITDPTANPFEPDADGYITVPPGVVGVAGPPEAFTQGIGPRGVTLDLSGPVLRNPDGSSEIRLYRLPDGTGGLGLGTGDTIADTGLTALAPGARIPVGAPDDPVPVPAARWERLWPVTESLTARQLPELREVLLSFYRADRAAAGEWWRQVETFADHELKALAGVPLQEWLRFTASEFGRSIKGAAYWVSEEMADIAETADRSGAMQGCGFAAHDLPCPQGWAYLDGTRTLVLARGDDDSDDPIELDGIRVLITWAEMAATPGSSLLPNGGVHFSVHIDRASFVTLRSWFDDYDSRADAERAMAGFAPYMLLGHGFAGFSETDEIGMFGPSAPQAGPWFGLFRGLCALLQQRLVTTTSEYAPRSVQRRHTRADARSLADQPVRVIRLRTQSGPSSESGTGIAYRHRWVVRGHWRQQACGPGRTQRRPVWIDPHVKGPEDAPLLGGEKVYSLHR